MGIKWLVWWMMIYVDLIDLVPVLMKIKKAQL